MQLCVINYAYATHQFRRRHYVFWLPRSPVYLSGQRSRIHLGSRMWWWMHPRWRWGVEVHLLVDHVCITVIVKQCCVMWYAYRESSRKTPTTIHLKDGERLVGDPAVAAVCMHLVYVAHILFLANCIVMSNHHHHHYHHHFI